ncbi:MAG: CRISPR-associated endonuclease Cas2, partial [Bacteroidales bacterium]|nr:CRISPR-associated endonuclease Cas2 [Bacteroidales bacterium]
MYDIASNKVRRAVVKYLQRRGCHRVQRSIFLA